MGIGNQSYFFVIRVEISVNIFEQSGSSILIGRYLSLPMEENITATTITQGLIEIVQILDILLCRFKEFYCAKNRNRDLMSFN